MAHLLAGQAPYKDFTVYLGAGELYSVGALLLVLGNSFGRSMFAASFCTWFYFELLVLAVCAVVTWKDVLLEDRRFRITAYARERFGIQWPGGAFSFNTLDPNTYFPADWSLEQIRAAFEALFLAEAEARSQAS